MRGEGGLEGRRKYRDFVRWNDGVLCFFYPEFEWRDKVVVVASRSCAKDLRQAWRTIGSQQIKDLKGPIFRLTDFCNTASFSVDPRNLFSHTVTN